MERKLLLLGLLRRQKMHGYQLHEFIDRYLSTCVDLKKSTAYYLLDKMAAEGLISESEAQVGNRPPRRVYSLTEVGERHFQALLRQNLAGYWPAYFAGDLGLAFLDHMEADEAMALLQERRRLLVQALARAESAPQHPGSMQYVVAHQKAHLLAELRWLDEVLAELAGPGKS